MSLERTLFGVPGAGSAAPGLDAARQGERNGFRQAVLELRGAAEEDLAGVVATAAQTGDSVLLRAARVVAQQKGFEGVVEQSIFNGGSDYEQQAYAERLALPASGNVRMIASAFAPERPTRAQITPSDAQRRAAEQSAQARRGGAIRYG